MTTYHADVVADTGWERIPLTIAMKRAIWSTQNDWFTLRNFSLPRELREYFPSKGLSPFAIVEQNKTLFLDLDLFFVKVSSNKWQLVADADFSRYLSSCS